MIIRTGGSVVVALVLAVSGPAVHAAAAPAAGDTYVYRLINGYSKEARGQLRYEVSRVEPDRITFSVTPDNAEAGLARTEIYSKDGNWLRALIESHGFPVEYNFAAAYPAFMFPLDTGKSWSLRVKASVEGARWSPRSVRVDGKVLGTERIRVPAGEFDAVKVRRYVYPGDEEFFQSETRITEFDWYAPALGRVVRTERRSEWREENRCDERNSCDYYGDWSVIELMAAPPAR